MKPAYEWRTKPAAVGYDYPPGFDINLGLATQPEAYATIEARLADARDSLPEGWSGHVIMHPYADGSVDGELWVKVPAGQHQGNIAWRLHEALGDASVGRQYWISMGTRYIIEADDVVYRRNKGMNMVQTNYQRATPTNIAEEDVILRHTILPGMRDRYRREAHSVFVRLHWNPENTQPKR